MKKLNNSLTSLIFAIVFLIIAVIRIDTDDWIDSAFYLMAVIGFILLFIASKKKNKS